MMEKSGSAILTSRWHQIPDGAISIGSGFYERNRAATDDVLHNRSGTRGKLETWT